MPHRSFFFILLVVLFMNGCRHPLFNDTHYLAGNQQRPIRIFYDSVGIVLQNKANPDSARQRMNTLGFTYVRMLSDEIMIFVNKKKKLQNEQGLVANLKTIAAQNKDLIETSGILTKTDYPIPFLLNNEINLEFKTAVTAGVKSQFFNSHGLKVIYQNPIKPFKYLVTPSGNITGSIFDFISSLHDTSVVDFVEPNFIIPVFPRSDPLTDYQWHLNNTLLNTGSTNTDADIDVDKAWTFVPAGSSTTIAILDFGFQLDHPNLIDNILAELAWDFSNCDEDDNGTCGDPIPDIDKHGTAVAGLAAASHYNDIATSGVCKSCKIIPIDIGSGSFSIAYAFDYAVQKGARIISCSFGYPKGFAPDRAIHAARVAGVIIFVAANDNGGNNCSSEITSLDGDVISVSSSNNFDKYGNHGIGECIDIVAPSYNVSGTGSLGMLTTDPIGTDGYNTGTSPTCGFTIPIDNNYTSCFDGTSAATPVVAGTAGLILSIDPTITPHKMQYLLQDCSDKIDPGACPYSDESGRTNYPGGNAKLGFGRINAYEAARIASSNSAIGGLNGVDIFIRDNDLDWGNTEQPSNTKFIYPLDFIPHWKSPDIKIDALADATGVNEPNTSEKFERFVTEKPVANKVNKVYVRIRNRGYNTAENVVVKLYWVYGGLALPALWSTFPNDITTDPDWKNLGSLTIPEVPYSGSSVALQKDAGGVSIDHAQIVSFDFTPPDPSLNPVNHYCLLAMIGCNADPLISNVETNLDLITPYFNNISHKNFQIDPDVSGTASGALYLYNPYNDLVKTKVNLIDLANIVDKIDPVFIDCTFILKPKQKIIISYTLKKAKLNSPTELTFIQEMIVDEKKKKKSKGGYTIYFMQ